MLSTNSLFNLNPAILSDSTYKLVQKVKNDPTMKLMGVVADNHSKVRPVEIPINQMVNAKEYRYNYTPPYWPLRG